MVSTTSVWPRFTRCSSIWSMLKCVLTPANRILPACLAARWTSSSSSVTSAGVLRLCRYQMSR